MMSSKIIGFYRCKDDDGSDLYIYVTKLPSGKLDYNFTKDWDEAASMAAKFCNSSDYTKDNYENIVNDPDRFNLNCKDYDEVLERIKRANPDEKINDDDFDYAIDDYDKDEEGIFTRIKEKISNSKFGTKVKNLWLNKKVKKVAIGAVATLTALGIASCSLNSCSGPTANNSRIATVDDTDDKDKTEEEDKAKEEKETKEKEETKTTDTTATETTASNANYSSTNSGSSSSNNTSSNNTSSNNTSSNVTSTPGSTNEDMNEFQDPDASLDDSNNQGGGSGEGNEQPEDPFDNVIEGEEPVDNNDNDNNNNNSEDEDYSEEIEVDVPGDNNTDDDYSEEIIIEEPEDSNINDNEEDNNYEDDELTEGDIDFDEGYENDPSVDDDYTFDPNYTNDGSSDYEIIYGELPDPNDTAADGDYVSDEEEITNDELTDVTDTDIIDDSDIVPVYQEETPYTEDTVSLPQNTIENSNTDLESAVDQAIEVMANGGDASITYDANTGQYSTEVTITNTNIEENGLTK